jgi:hypothetical protein
MISFIMRHERGHDGVAPGVGLSQVGLAKTLGRNVMTLDTRHVR